MAKARRVELGAILHAIMLSSKDADNNPYPDNVYFQPGPSVTMLYPCIVYERDNASTKYADGSPYNYVQRYSVTYIDKSPDSDVIDKLAALPLSSFNRHFATSGLNHDVFTIYH